MLEGYIGVRPFFIFALFLLLAWVIFWPLIKSNQKPSVFWVAVVILSMAGVGFGEFKWVSVQNEATSLTKQVSGNPEGHVVCQRFTTAFMDAQVSTLGFVAYSEGNKSNVKYAQCKKWGEFLEANKKQLTDEHLLAVGVVIHEAYHVGGEFNEAVTQCLTMKKMPEVLKQYGVSDDYATIYADKYREMSQRMPPEYLNGTC